MDSKLAKTPQPSTRRFGLVEIRDAPGKGQGVFACKNFSPGEVVMVGRAVEMVPDRTNYSVQIDWDRHALFDQPSILSNHSCDPNSGLRENAHNGYDFIARRPIARGEEITWDYSMSEHTSIAVETCRCGAVSCRIHPTGYKDLTKAQREAYAGFCADYLNRMPIA